MKSACRCLVLAAGLFLPASLALPVSDYFQCVHSIPAESLGDHYFAVTKRFGAAIAHHVDVVWRALDESHESHRSLALLREEGHDEAHPTDVHFVGEHADFFQAAEDYYVALSDGDCPALATLSQPSTVSGGEFACVRVPLHEDLFETTCPFHVEALDADADHVEMQFAVYFVDEGHDEGHEEHRSLHSEHERRTLAADDHGDDHAVGENMVHYGDIMSLRSSATGVAIPFVDNVSSELEQEAEDHVKESTKGEPIIAAFIVNLVTLIGITFMVPVARDLLVKTPVSTSRSMISTSTELVKSANAVEQGCVLGTDGKTDSCSTQKPNADIVPTLHQGSHNHSDALPSGVFSPFVILLISSFSGGCIIATALYLVLPEALFMIGASGWEEGLVTAHWGSFILAGFIFPYVASFVIDSFVGPSTSSGSKEDLDLTAASNRRRLICGCLIGDAFHNFADGAFIGAAFLHCSPFFGWVVTMTSILHELAQESADFFILTGPGGLPPLVALGTNFLSGTACIWGAILVVFVGLSDVAIGYILAFGGGVYLQVGAAECFPRAIQCATTTKLRLTILFVFFLGALPIGLVLLDHKHCAATGMEGGEGDVHNH